MTDDGKRTALYDLHVKLNAKIVPFGGWSMPLSYQGVLQEHQTVRNNSGIFDVSHMGEIFVSGARALEFLQHVTMNDVSRLNVGQGQYSAFLNETGGFVDDLILYRLEPQRYLLCVNASNDAKDFAWLSKLAPQFSVKLEHASSQYSQIALQGPTVKTIIPRAFDAPMATALTKLDYMEVADLSNGSQHLIAARTGYTGELGFEFYCDHETARKLWTRFIECGALPIGLGARDTLRTEPCYLLYGNDMDDSVDPLEAGVSWAFKPKKGNFIGRDAVLAKTARRKMYGFKMVESAIPRHGMDVYNDANQKIGTVTSGSVLPTVGGSGGMLLISEPNLSPGAKVWIDVRGKRKLAEIAARPLYSPKVR